MMYIGDGVYAVFDGGYVWLYTDVDGQRHSIALEQEGLDNLTAFVEKIRNGDVSVSQAPR